MARNTKLAFMEEFRQIMHETVISPLFTLFTARKPQVFHENSRKRRVDTKGAAGEFTSPRRNREQESNTGGRSRALRDPVCASPLLASASANAAERILKPRRVEVSVN